MLDYQLFLGFPLTSVYKQELQQLPLPLLTAFINNNDPDYLQEIEHQGCFYLGKEVGKCVEWRTLENSSMHLSSLLKKLIPHYAYAKQDFVLLAIPFPK